MDESKKAMTFDQVATMPKLFFLAIMSIALSTLGPMSIFTAVPLTMIALMYGRTLAIISGILSIIAMTVGMTVLHAIPLYIVVSFALAFVVSVLVSEVIRKDVPPMRGIIATGFTLVILMFAVTYGIDKYSQTPVKEQIGQTVTLMTNELKKQKDQATSLTTDEEVAFDEVINNPQKLTDQIYQSLPMIIFLYVFFVLWVTMYVTLRNQVVWRSRQAYSYSLSVMANYKAPEFLVYPVIAALVLWLAADYGLPAYAGIIGENVLYCLAVFYFFQGFGVYSALLNNLRIRGFFKTLLIALTVLLAARFIALVGLFDLWFDFRKKLKNKKRNEGDTI